MENVSGVTVFTLTGLEFTLEQKIVLFLLTLLWYFMILLGNITVLVCIILDKNLHEPMYIFLCNLCINALYGTAGFYPKFLLDLLSSHVISYAGCMLQGYVIHSSTCCDFTILALMAYDRYLAICRPLVYHSVMTKQRVSVFVFLCWFLPLSCMFMNTVTVMQSRLCGSHIQKIYCVNWMVTKLACSPPKGNAAVTYFNIVFFFGQVVFIFWSYVHLVRTCRASVETRGRFIQTCSPHLISLLTNSITVLLDLLYMRFGSADLSQDLSNFMSIEFLLIPPLVNPIIYGLKLSKVRKRIFSLLHIKEKDSEPQAVIHHVNAEH